MTQMVTRCPKCATAFRITSTQLESAKGAVRCGSCLHIFKAQDFLVKSPAPETAAQTTKTTAAIAAKAEAPKIEAPKIEEPKPEVVKPAPVIVPKIEKPEAIAPAQEPIAPKVPEPEKMVSAKLGIDKAKALEDEDDVLISDDMDKVDEKASTYEFDGFMDVDLQPKQTVSLFEREIRYDELKDNDDEQGTDESWAEDLLDDDEETLHQLKKTPPPIEPAAETESERETSTAETTLFKESETGYSGPIFSLISDTADETGTESEYKEHPNEHAFSEAFLTATSAVEAAPATSESSEFAASLFEAETGSDEQEEKAPSKRPVKSPKMRAFDTSRAALLMNIMPAPVEFTAKRMRRWYQQKLWPTLSILMAALLFFQVAYFKFDYFSRVEPTRTAYLFMCPLLGCDVPPLVDIMEIETTNLIVRNHPKVGEALLVDAILINKAPFEQPFPDLILSFSKLDETPVASRRFTPKEYLGGELAGMKYIPERQPVHIALEIADPGPEAVNYTLSAH
ncbi:MAG TPA: DUF3426 domain-containing protein [Cellvibrio sp.]|nr:DUF3426 domain-containing protein [Cellvibrio sp.]